MAEIVTRFPRAIRKIETVWIPVRDGTKLAATIWLPEDAEKNPVPAVLEFIPYRRRDFTATGDARHHPFIAGHGYAAVRCDLRGNGDSEGLFDDEYSKQELDDGYHVLEWLAKQNWCTGRTGMMGISWGGFNCLQVAALRPPSLKAVYSVCSTDDRYADDVHFQGGCLLNENISWGATATIFAMRSPDPASVGRKWETMWRKRLDNAPNLSALWLRHQRRDAQWKHGSVCENYGAIKAAVYAVGGWADGYTNAIPRLLAGLRSPSRGLIGPWTHCYPWKAVPGPEIDGLGDLCRWWDHWLKDIDTGMMDEPKFRVWMQESVPPATFYAHRPGRWVAEESWPSKRIEWRRFHLNEDGLGSKAKGATALAHRSEVIAGITHGDWCPYGHDAEMPSDQREEDGRSLAFETPPLTKRIETLGAPVLTLDVESDKPNAQVYVRLCDVAPDGASTRVSFATLNLTHRNGHERPEPLKPGKRYKVRVQLTDIAHVFPAGNRIRVTVQTHAWPMIWPSPEDATITVHTGTSVFDLPVRPLRAADAKLKSLGTSRVAAPLEVTQWRPYHRARRLSRDFVSGETTVVMIKDRGHYRIEQTGTELANPGMETYTIRDGDPLSARAQCDHTIILKRGTEWDTRIETKSVLTSTRESFRISVHAQAWNGSERIWSRSWEDEIPRDGV